MPAKRSALSNLRRLTQQEAADICGVTSRTLRDWAMAPRNPDGSYDARALVEWLVARASSESEYESQRERLAAAQAERVEAENAVRRRELVAVGDAAAEWTGYVFAARAKLLAIPSKLAHRMVGLVDPHDAESRIRAEVVAALAELAAGDCVGGDDVGAAADVDGQRVGRRASETQ